jgi:hypothetical protein
MARIAHASKFLVPGKSGARVFYWEDVNGFRVRRAAGRRNYDSIWEGYGDKQRRYDSFRNEWDLCEDFDPTDGPEEDSESDDTADPPRVSADHISVEQGGGTMEVVQDPAVVPVGHISLQQLVNQAGDETDMDITPSAELGDPMDVVQPDLTDNYIAQRKTPADDGIDEDEEGQLGKEVGDGEQEEEQGSTESGNLIRQKQKEGDGIEEQRRKKIEEKRKRALEDLELTRKRKLATRQRSKMQARKEKAEGQEEEEDKEEGEEDKEQEDEEQDEDEEQEAEENVLAPVKPTWKKRVMAKGGLKGKRKGKSSSMHAAQTGHLLLEGHVSGFSIAWIPDSSSHP